MIKTKFLID